MAKIANFFVRAKRLIQFSESRTETEIDKIYRGETLVWEKDRVRFPSPTLSEDWDESESTFFLAAEGWYQDRNSKKSRYFNVNTKELTDELFIEDPKYTWTKTTGTPLDNNHKFSDGWIFRECEVRMLTNCHYGADSSYPRYSHDGEFIKASFNTIKLFKEFNLKTGSTYFGCYLVKTQGGNSFALDETITFIVGIKSSLSNTYFSSNSYYKPCISYAHSEYTDASLAKVPDDKLWIIADFNYQHTVWFNPVTGEFFIAYGSNGTAGNWQDWWAQYCPPVVENGWTRADSLPINGAYNSGFDKYIINKLSTGLTQWYYTPVEKDGVQWYELYNSLTGKHLFVPKEVITEPKHSSMTTAVYKSKDPFYPADSGWYFSELEEKVVIFNINTQEVIYNLRLDIIPGMSGLTPSVKYISKPYRTSDKDIIPLVSNSEFVFQNWSLGSNSEILYPGARQLVATNDSLIAHWKGKHVFNTGTVVLTCARSFRDNDYYGYAYTATSGTTTENVSLSKYNPHAYDKNIIAFPYGSQNLPYLDLEQYESTTGSTKLRYRMNQFSNGSVVTRNYDIDTYRGTICPFRSFFVTYMDYPDIGTTRYMFDYESGVYGIGFCNRTGGGLYPDIENLDLLTIPCFRIYNGNSGRSCVFIVPSSQVSVKRPDGTSKTYTNSYSSTTSWKRYVVFVDYGVFASDGLDIYEGGTITIFEIGSSSVQGYSPDKSYDVFPNSESTPKEVFSRECKLTCT